MKVLTNNNINFIHEFSIKKPDNIHCYFLDFYIEVNSIKIDLEIDGKQHEERQCLDEARDEYLTSQGICVYRIK